MRKSITVVALVCSFLLGVAVGGGQPLEAEDTCSVAYERDAISAWDAYNTCIVSTISESWYQKLLTRNFCRGEYLVDALAAASELTACVSVGNLWPDRN